VAWVYKKTMLYIFGGQGRKDKLSNKIMFIELSTTEDDSFTLHTDRRMHT
jgi:hypothetical protein